MSEPNPVPVSEETEKQILVCESLLRKGHLHIGHAQTAGLSANDLLGLVDKGLLERAGAGIYRRTELVYFPYKHFEPKEYKVVTATDKEDPDEGSA